MQLEINFVNGKTHLLNTSEIGNVNVNIHINKELGFRIILTNTSEKLNLNLMKVFDEIINVYGETVDILSDKIVENLKIYDDENNLLNEIQNMSILYSYNEGNMLEIIHFDQNREVRPTIDYSR